MIFLMFFFGALWVEKCEGPGDVHIHKYDSLY